MSIIEFPPIECADEDGFLAIGGDVEVSSLLLAYRNGIFLWPVRDDLLTWFAPPQRALLFFESLHLPQRLQRTFAQGKFEVRMNTRFRHVIEKCAELQNRGQQQGTWITSAVIEGYTALHERGYAHSVETYYEQKLVGGIYGVSIGRMFAGESMFYRQSNASKIALLALIAYLRHSGCQWLDCQMMTPVTETLGAKLLPRDEFHKLLQSALKHPNIHFPEGVISQETLREWFQTL